MAVKSVAILGAGNGGFAAAADLSRRGYEVRLHARNPERLAGLKKSSAIEARGIVAGRIPVAKVTTDVRDAVAGADLIMLVVPTVAHKYYARALAPLLDGRTPIFLNPGHTLGGLHFLHELRLAGYIGTQKLCETVSLTYVTRMEGPATVAVYSYIKRLGFSSLPGKFADEMFDLVSPLYPEIVKASSVIETALSNMNAVFHPPGMIMNAGWIEDTGGNFKFYREGITPAIGRVTTSVDADRVAVAKALNVPFTTFLDAFYASGLTTKEARDSGDISLACKESAPNATIKSPSSLNHRYLHEDVGHGLVPMSALGRLAGVPTPTIDSLIHISGLALNIDFSRDGLTLEKLGLSGMTPSELTRFVQEGALDGRKG
jgi:opine dehydrogenase